MDNIFMPLIAVIGLIIYVWVTNKQKQEERKRIAKQKEDEQRERERKEAEHRRMMEEAERFVALYELMNQAKAVGDVETYEKVKNNKYMGKVPTRPDGQWQSMYDNLMILKIAGINYRGNLSAYVGKFKGVLKPEPKNDYDPNAIMIKCEDGKHLGYVPEDKTEDVRAFIGADGVDFNPYRIEGDIEECEDDDERKFFVGRIYVVKK